MGEFRLSFRFDLFCSSLGVIATGLSGERLSVFFCGCCVWDGLVFCFGLFSVSVGRHFLDTGCLLVRQICLAVFVS